MQTIIQETLLPQQQDLKVNALINYKKTQQKKAIGITIVIGVLSIAAWVLSIWYHQNHY